MIVDPNGFTGWGIERGHDTVERKHGVPGKNFPNLAHRGEFLGKYSKWSADPTNYLS